MPEIINRTWRVQAFTDHGAIPRVEWLRETRKVYDDGENLRVKGSESAAARSLADIEAQPIPGGPVVCTTRGDAFALFMRMGDEFAAEDATAAKAWAEAKAAAAKEAADSEAKA